MTKWYYQHSGLSIVSELHLPEWKIFERSMLSVPLDLTIQWHIHRSQEELEIAPLISAEQYAFFVPEAGQFRVSRTGEIEIFAVADPDMKKVRMILLGTAWASFCYLRGLLLLHASVVATDTGAAALCGESGAGKSSLAARLAQTGCSVLSDDLCRIILGSPPLVYRSAGRIKLWQNALTSLHMEGKDTWERDHARMEKFHVPLAKASEQDFLPLQAVYVLVWGELRLTRLTGIEALRRLIAASAYRGELLEPMGKLADHWVHCAKLAKMVPIWELSRPRDWACMNDAADLILSRSVL